MDKKVARPAGDVDAPELRKDASLRKMAAYIKEAAPKNDSKFDFFQYWEARGTDDGVDPSGKAVVPARWAYIGFLTTSYYADIDTSLVICAPVLWLTRERRCCCSGSTGTHAPYSRICEGRTGT